MSEVRVITPFNVEVEFTSPPFHRRLFAWFIDGLVQLFFLILALRLYDHLESKLLYQKYGSYTLWAIGLVLVLPFLVYHLFMEISMNGQSIGKRILSMKVISENCGRPTVSQYLVRWLLRTSDYSIFILLLMIPYAANNSSAAFWGMAGTVALLITDVILVNTGKQQRLGDIIAHTLLVNTEIKGKLSDTIFLEVDQKYQPTFPQVLQLPDKHLNTLKSILDTSKEKRDPELAERAAEKIKEHLQLNTSMKPIEFLETLLRDYNYLTHQ